MKLFKFYIFFSIIFFSILLNNDLLSLDNERIKKIEDYLNKLNTIHIYWKELNEKIIKECKHDYIMEREPGQYGELYTFCSKCRVDKSLSFIHR